MIIEEYLLLKGNMVTCTGKGDYNEPAIAKICNLICNEPFDYQDDCDTKIVTVNKCNLSDFHTPCEFSLR